jgi:hypothetical protein
VTRRGRLTLEGRVGHNKNHQSSINDKKNPDEVDEDAFRSDLMFRNVEQRVLVETDETGGDRHDETSCSKEDVNRQVKSFQLATDPGCQEAGKPDDELTEENDDRCHSHP